MLRRRDILTLSFIMNGILEPEDGNELLGLVEYGSEWEEAMKKLTISINDPVLNKHVAKTILDKYMWSCPINDLESKVLAIVCPFLKASIFEIVEDIERQLDDSEFMRNAEPTSFDGQFIEIKNLLARWHEILRHTVQIQKTPATIESLLKYLPSTVIKICSHCRNSRERYPSRTLPLLLQDIYRDTCSVVKNYCALFLRQFRLNVCKNAEIDTLKQIITDLGDIAPYTTYGMSTMVQTWKTFKYLACFKVSFLANRKDCVDRIRGYFKTIGKNINRLYKQVMMRSESEFITRAKCANLLLDLFTQLHQTFCEDMSQYPLEEVFVCDMIPILIEFVGHYEVCRGWNFDTVKCDRRDQIIINRWPSMLFQYYEKSPYYLTEFRSQAKGKKIKNDSDYALGFHYCLLHYGVFDKPERLDMALENINNIQVEVMEQITRWPDWGTAEGGMIEACIYEYTLSILCQICDFTTTGASFGDYEDILLKHLLGERFWSSLLAHDILIHCYMCSDKTVASTHIQYFMMAYETLHERRDDSLAVTMLRRIIQDIYEILPHDKDEQFTDICQSPDSLLIILQSNSEDSSHKKLLATYKKLCATMLPNNLPEAISNLEKQPSATNWIRFINQLTVMGIEKKEPNNKLTENLLEIASLTWQTAIEVEDVNLQQMMYDLILKLFDCTRVEDRRRRTCWFNWKLFVELAEKLLKTADIPECVLIKLCHFLTRNEDCLAGPYDGSEATLIPAMFIYLLENESQLVHQEALECFDRISEKSNENFVKLISNAIAKRPNLCETVRAYVERQPLPELSNEDTMPPGWRNYTKLSTHFNNFAVKHKCHKNDIRIRNTKFPKLDHEALSEHVLGLTNELMALTHQDINLVPDAAVKLKNVCRLILES